jgi:hypothetical protein
MVHASLFKCTNCGTAVDFRIMGVSSNLGPPVVTCHWCKQVMSSERLEWDDMATRTKVFYVVMSIVYAAVVGLLGGMAVDATVQFIQTGAMRFRYGWSEPAFWIGAAVYGALTVLLQIYRVHCSRWRSRTAPGQPIKGFVFNVQTYLQGKVLLLVIVVPGILWLVSWLREKL